MKKLVYLILAGILACSFIASAETTGVIFDGNKVRISVEKYEPHPVAPGEYFDIWIKVQALWTTPTDYTLRDFKIEIVEKYPFMVDSSDNIIKEFGDLHEGEQVVFKYRIRVMDDAVEGTNQLRFKYYSNNIASEESPPLDIEVATRDTTLVIKQFTAVPEELSAGSKGTVKLTIENPTDSLMRNINVKLNLFSLPITALNSIAEKQIYSLSSGKETEMAFDIIVDPDAASKVYKVPVELRYADSAGTAYSLNNSIALLVKSQSDYQIDLIDTKVYTSSSFGKVTLGVSNKGTSELKFVSMEIQPSDYYKILSPSRVYIGNIESDDFDTAEFDLYVTRTWKDAIPVKVLLTYKDSFNQELNKYLEVNLPLYSKSEAVKYGLMQGSSTFRFLIYIVLLLIVGWIFYKQYRKTRVLSSAAKNTFKIIYEWIIRMIKKLLHLPKKIMHKIFRRK